MDAGNLLLTLTSPLVVANALSDKLKRAAPEDRPRLENLPDLTVFAVFDQERFLGLVTADQVAAHPQRILADLLPNPLPPALAPDTPVATAKRRLELERIGALPVVDGEGKFLGAVTLVSLLEALLEEESRVKAQVAVSFAACRKQCESLQAALSNSKALYAAGKRLLELALQERGKDGLLQTALELVGALVAARYGALVVSDPQGKTQKFFYYGIDPKTAAKIGRLPEGKGVLGPEILGKRRIMRLEDLTAHPAFSGFPAHHPKMQNLVAACISYRGQGLGRVYLCDRKDGQPFTAEDELEVKNFAELLALVLSQEEKHARLKLDRQLAARVFEQASEGILITDAEQKILYVNPALCAITGYREEELLGKTPRIFRSGYHEQEFYRELWLSLNERGQWQGEIWNKRKNGEVYPEWLRISALVDEQGQVSHYVAVFSDLSQSPVTAAKGLERLVHFDHLTGLPNRLTFQAELKQAMWRTRFSGKFTGLILLDLDRFKSINDYCGHQLGDSLLQQVAKRLISAVRKQEAPRVGDVVARLSGDEFAVLVNDLNSPEEMEKIAAKLLERFAEPFQLGGLQRRVTASLGVAVYPGEAETPADFLRQADLALYQAKRERKRVCRYTSALHRQDLRRVKLEHALYQALARGELALHYQLQVELKSGRVVGFEALLRWFHPEFGAVSPAEFVPLLEEIGLIEEVGEWAIAQAVSASLKLRAEFGAGIQVAVNLSMRQLNERLIAYLKSAAIKPVLECLELELTETMAMGDPEDALKCLAELKRLGVPLWIDDFGTGYSSLSYLTRLPIMGLKIDASFVRHMLENPADLAVVTGVIALGHSLELEVLAEGVETVAQAEKLKSLGCALAQGYLFGKPKPLEELLTGSFSIPS
jgi:diguanylate cyclase (GGDEF)-like protein/PAS domain S-box-containing protein